MKTVHHQDTLYYFVPLQQGSQSATSAPSKCSYKARFLQREKQSGNGKLVAVLHFRSNAWWGEHWEELFCVPGISCKMSGFPALTCTRSSGCQRGSSPCSVSCLGTEPAQVHPYVSSGLSFWRWHQRCYSSERRSTEAEFSEIQHLSHPLFNAISDVATCIYIYI